MPGPIDDEPFVGRIEPDVKWMALAALPYRANKMHDGWVGGSLCVGGSIRLARGLAGRNSPRHPQGQEHE